MDTYSSQEDFDNENLSRGAGDPDTHGYQDMNVSELIESLGETKKFQAEAYKKYQEFKDIETELKLELTSKLHTLGLKSAKGEDFTASITEKPRIVIKNETAVMEWLKNTPDVEADFYIGVKGREFQALATQMLKESGELADGTELQMTESLAVRQNSKAKKAPVF